MKQFLIFLFVICWSSIQAQLINGNYQLITHKSVITWKVDYSIGTSGHTGTLSLTSGSVLMKNGIIEGGNFIIDMNSVYVTDIKPENKGKKTLRIT